MFISEWYESTAIDRFTMWKLGHVFCFEIHDNEHT